MRHPARSFLKQVLLFVSLFMPFVGFSQQAAITLYAEEQGLNRVYIHDLVKGGNQFIWLATEKGIIRFDGSNFIEFSPDKGALVNPEITLLRIHKFDLYLVYKDSGLYRFNTSTFKSDKITHEPVSDVVVLSDSQLVYSTKKGELVLYGIDKPILTRRYSKHGQSLMRYFQGKLVVNFFYVGMKVLNPHTLEVEKELPFFSQGDYERFEADGLNLVYIAKDSLFNINSDFRIKEWSPIEGQTLRSVTDMSFLSVNKRFLLTHRKSLFKQDGNRLTEIPLKGYVNLELKKALPIDNDNLLIGTNQGLLKVRMQRSGVRTIDDNIPLLENSLRIRRKILETEEGDLILTGHSYSYRYGKEMQFRKIITQPFSMFDALLIGDTMYATTEDHGLQRILLSRGISNTIPVIPEGKINAITSIARETKTGSLYLGGIGFLAVHQPRNGKTRHHLLPDPQARIRYICIDSAHSRIWLGMENGLYHAQLRPDSIADIKPFDLTGHIIGDLHIAKGSQDLWVGHDKGVQVIDLNTLKIKHTIPCDIFVNPRVTGILEDKAGRMWFSTYSGISGFDPKTGDFIRLNKRSGLFNSEYNYKACLATKKGELVFGGLNGYDIISPENYQFVRASNIGIVSGVQFFSDHDTILRGIGNFEKNIIRFNTENEHLRIYLTVKDLVSADNYTYQFKLGNGEWINANLQSHIKIIKLDPGNYKLQARAFSEFGSPVYFEPMTLIAEQPFIKSRSFLAMLTLFSFVSMFTVIAQYRLSRKKQQQLKESIAMDLHDEVGTILTRTLYIENQTKPDDPLRSFIPKYLNEALFSLRVYIQTMNKDEFSLLSLRDELHDIVISTVTPSRIKLDFHSEIKENVKLEAKLYRDIKLCIYEMTNNIVKHAQSTQCRMEVLAAKGQLTILLEDNGCLKEIDKIENKGNGINNLRKRVGRNSGTILFRISETCSGLVSVMTFQLNTRT